jgi:hypothetical protein
MWKVNGFSGQIIFSTYRVTSDKYRSAIGMELASEMRLLDLVGLRLERFQPA